MTNPPYSFLRARKTFDFNNCDEYAAMASVALAATKLDEKREALAKTLMASPLIKRKNRRVVEQFRRTTAYGG